MNAIKTQDCQHVEISIHAPLEPKNVANILNSCIDADVVSPPVEILVDDNGTPVRVDGCLQLRPADETSVNIVGKWVHYRGQK